MTIILSIIFVLITGCSTFDKKNSISVLPSNLSELTPEKVLFLVKERHGELRTLKGEGNFSLRYQGREFKAKGVIWAGRDSFRLDIFNPFLQLVYTITYYEGVVSVLSLKEKRLYRGIGLYNPVFSFPVDPSMFLSFLFGEFPSALFKQDTLSFKEVVNWEMDKDRGLYFLEILSKEGLRYKMWVRPGEKVMIEGEAYNLNGDMISSVKGEKFDSIDGTLFPRRITAKYQDGMAMSIDFLRVSLKEDIKEDVFRLSLPPGIEEVNMLPP